MKTRLVLTAFVALTIGIAIGSAWGPQASAQGAAAGQATAVKPAFLVASTRPIQPDKMGPYSAAAGPLARQAGMEMLAQGDPTLHVLEGKWPVNGGLTVERYRSMQDLVNFWNSTGYQEAKKLRQGLMDVNFIVAIEGR